MSGGDWFVAANILLNSGAAVFYACAGRWNEAIYWTAAVVLTGSILWRSWA